MRQLRWLGAALLAAPIGCLGIGEPRQPSFKPPDPIRVKPPMDAVKANSAAATRVDSVGRALLAANPRIDAKPIFQTVGTPAPEIFHVGTNRIVITQGLVDQCRTDDELAAVLAVEIGKMVAAREAIAPVTVRRDRPPIDPGLPGGVVGVGVRDIDRLQEIGKFEMSRSDTAKAGTPPDPMELARLYLTRAERPADAIDRVKPQLRAAAANSTMEKQMTGMNQPAGFRPPG